MSKNNNFLYETIYYDLKQKIIDAKFPFGSFLPNEIQLSKHYHVSRVTIRAALDKLAEEKYILRRPKIGTLVIYEASKREKPLFVLLIPYSQHRKINTTLLSACYNEAKKLDISFISYNTNEVDEMKSLESALKQNIDGILMYPCSRSIHVATYLDILQRNIPLVFIDRRLPLFNSTPLISTNNTQAMFNLVEHIIEKGYRNIAYLGNLTSMYSSEQNRFIGFCEALQKHNIPICASNFFNIQKLEKSSSSLFFALRKLLINLKETKQLPQVICCVNDYTAITLINVCKDLNLNIPHDLCITGFDNLDTTQLPDVALTTIAQDFSRIGTLATQTLYALYNKQPISQSLVLVDAKIKTRKSIYLSKYKKKPLKNN